MRTRVCAMAIGAVVAVLAGVAGSPVRATPESQYDGPYFGAGNLPPGCIADMSATNPANICHHLWTDMNALDSPQVDVLVMVPASPTAERDMRIVRQAVEMWEGGVDYLAPQMGLGWLAQGLDFHITVDTFDPAGGGGGEFTTYPIVDPEIVVIATNPGTGSGVGVDPVDLVPAWQPPVPQDVVVFAGEDLVPCHSVSNPFDFEYWAGLPGFTSHHESRSGTYTEDCGGAGGNICFSVVDALDPAPDTIDLAGLFDIVAHEFGHCMTLGHVGDGGNEYWGVVPTNDIMAYSTDPPDLNNCVSTLDVEGVALRMSRYLDVDGDGDVDGDDRLEANDPVGNGQSPFQVQHPGDHLYASSTGSPMDCPQPDLGLTPGPRTDWTPTPATVAAPTARAATHEDAADDARAPMTEILELDAEVTDTDVVATIRLADLWPTMAVTSATTYSVLVNGHRFDSFVLTDGGPNPKTWDRHAAAYMAEGTSTWDEAAGAVTFRLPRARLSGAGVDAPYYLSSQASYRVPRTAGYSLAAGVVDDRAPDLGRRVALAG